MENKYTKMAIVTTGVAAAAILTSITGILYLAEALYEVNPAYPGTAAFVAFGCIGSYLLFSKMHKFVISQLAEMDLEKEENK